MNNIIPLLGERGSDEIADTGAYTGKWSAIQMHADSVFATLTAVNRTTHGSVSGKTYAKGEVIFGAFTEITLASGWVEAYNAE
ncbi:MAG: hypothetical protein NTU88_12600 [Armatimonadetes bacterium]|nr:hypothetical protein [Armatimonadota bacterium]